MKKIGFALLVAGILAACNVTVVVPGPEPGTPVEVDDPNGVEVTLAPNATERFELTIATEPVRVDVYHTEATADGELYIEAFDKSGAAYAHTQSRAYFAKADATLTSLDVAAQDVSVGFPYSVNLPKDMGKVYIEVTNKTATNATVTVKVVTRNEVVRNGVSLESPTGAETSKVYGGALLFLGQQDTYVYNGASNCQLAFEVPPGDYVHAQLILNDNNVITPGTGGIILLAGDELRVESQGLERAGFCDTVDSGCPDNIDTGEYTLTISSCP